MWSGVGALRLPLLGEPVSPRFSVTQQGKHKAPATATHPPLTPTHLHFQSLVVSKKPIVESTPIAVFPNG
jgi:hypothetical protein